MLQKIHDNAKGWVAYLIVGLISVPFALWGIQEYLGGGESRVAATVNGEEISVQKVNNQVQQQRNRMLQMFGGRLPPGFDDSALKESAVEALVTQEILKEKAEDVGYRASNAEVLQSITSIPNFQKDGKFDQQTYVALLRSSGRSAAQFEQELRDELTREQFTKGVRDTGFVPASEAKQYHALQNQTRSVEFFTVKVDDYKDQIKIDDKRVDEHYKANNALYMTDEKVQIAYIELDKNELSKQIEVTDEALNDYYNKNIDTYYTQDEFTVSHILLKTSAERDEAVTKALAEDLHAAITSGAKTFEDVVKANSDDKQSIDKKGSLGKIAKGDMDPAFEKAAFALKQGEISEPVKTALGYEIIRVDQLTEAKQKSFEEARADIERDYRAETADRRFYDDSEALTRFAFEQSGSLDPSADATNTKVQSSELFSQQGGAGITSAPAVVKAAFSDQVRGGQNSDLIKITPDKVAVIRALNYVKPVLKPLDEVKESIVKQLTDIDVRKKTEEVGKGLLEKVAAANSWAQLSEIKAEESAVEKHENITRAGSELPPHIVTQLFKMQAADEEGKASYSSLAAPNGDYIVMALKAVKDGEGDISNSAKSRFASYIANREITAAMKALRDTAEVTIDRDSLKSRTQ